MPEELHIQYSNSLLSGTGELSLWVIGGGVVLPLLIDALVAFFTTS